MDHDERLARPLLSSAHPAPPADIYADPDHDAAGEVRRTLRELAEARPATRVAIAAVVPGAISVIASPMLKHNTKATPSHIWFT